MQIDRWTVDADEHSDGENNVNFSVWIDPVGQQHMSASYFNQEMTPQEKMNPITPTPIPPRASAPGVVKVRPRYPHSYTLVQEEDVTGMPTLPQPIMWQYDSAEYQAESSLSSLSLVVPEMALKDSERRYITPNPHPAIEDMKTIPPAKKGKQQKPRQQKKKLQLPIPRAIYDVDTVPPKARKTSISLPGSGRALSTLRPQLPLVPAEEGDLRSWTAGGGANSIHARRIASEDRRAARFNPLDRMRWWLLWPGRIEFLLWFAGTITLMAVTCIFLFATVVSFGVINLGGGIRTSDTPPSSLATSTTGSIPCTTQNTPCSNAQAPGKTHMLFSLLKQEPLIAGMSIRMKGQGFSPNATITFTHDAGLPCEPTSQQTDAQGSFFVAIQSGPSWAVGKHVITAYDPSSKRLINASITIFAPFGKSTTPTGAGTALPATPGPGIPPTSVAGGGQPNPLPTPVGQYPVTPTPTSVPATPTATPTQTPPTPTPTVGVKPTPTQLPKPTPTQLPKPTPTVVKGKSITPTTANSSVTSSQVTALNANATYSSLHTTSGMWLWLVLIGYALSMVMLGIAGVLHHRKQAQRTRS